MIRFHIFYKYKVVFFIIFIGFIIKCMFFDHLCIIYYYFCIIFLKKFPVLLDFFVSFLVYL